MKSCSRYSEGARPRRDRETGEGVSGKQTPSTQRIPPRAALWRRRELTLPARPFFKSYPAALPGRGSLNARVPPTQVSATATRLRCGAALPSGSSVSFRFLSSHRLQVGFLFVGLFVCMQFEIKF